MTLVIIVFGFYFLLLLVLLRGWRIAKAKKFPRLDRAKKLRITVVVPFRNEEQNLVDIIRDLIHQNYHAEGFEVLLCNDHSEDGSVQRAKKELSGLGNFRVINSPKPGKKSAISYAIENATGEIIATTDADCRLPENWLTRINDSFQDPDVKMIFGGVKIREDGTFFSRLQALEFSSLIGSGAATAALGFPTMCNGANLAFLKSAFLAVNGYEGNLHVPSGDGEFLMRKMVKQFPGSFSFLTAPDSVVSTLPQGSLGSFIHQRIRWAGKWKHNPSPVPRWIAVLILVVQTSFLALVVMTVIHHTNIQAALFLIGIKLFLEFVFLFQIGSFLKQKWRTSYFLLLQLLYPLYVILIGLAANFASYEWKGRKWKNKTNNHYKKPPP